MLVRLGLGTLVGVLTVAANWCRWWLAGVVCRVGAFVIGDWKSSGSKMAPGGRPNLGSWFVMGKEQPVTVLVMSFVETDMFMPSAVIVGHPTIVLMVTSLLSVKEMMQGLPSVVVYGVLYRTTADSSPRMSRP